MKRIIVTGGRDYGKLDPKRPLEHPRRLAERKKVCEVLGKLLVEIGTFQLISGGAPGADALAEIWVKDACGFPKPIVFPAYWDDIARPGAIVKTHKAGPKQGQKYDAAAGPARNQRMVDEGNADLVIAFPGGAGTADMVSRARAAGIEIMEIEQCRAYS